MWILERANVHGCGVYGHGETLGRKSVGIAGGNSIFVNLFGE